MNSNLSEGYAREIPQSVFSISKHPTWYLHYHPAMNVNKPGKVRVVCNCAAKCNGMSLNDALLNSPRILNSSTGVFFRFRRNTIAMVADVEAMFHQIKVDSLHIDALRILWWENGDLSKKILLCARSLFISLEQNNLQAEPILACVKLLSSWRSLLTCHFFHHIYSAMAPVFSFCLVDHCGLFAYFFSWRSQD